MAYCYRHPDRETGLSCSVCERPVCTDCATFAAVGIRCPDHAGGPKQAPAAQARRRARRRSWASTPGIVTQLLIGLNVLVYVVNLVQGASLSANGGSLFESLALQGAVLRLDDEWWRLLTATFLHANLLHLGLNMLMLWWVGTPVEEWLGRWRYLSLYLVSGLAGSAGALLLSDPFDVTVGASGAIFGLLGAALVFEQQRNFVLGGSALSIIVLNLILTFYSASTGGRISLGGHLGGLVGGALVGLALSRFGRGHAAYRRLGAAEIAGIVGVLVLSLGLAYWRVESYIT